MLQGGSDRPSVCVSRCPDPQEEAGQNNNLKSTMGPTKYAPLDPIKKKTVQWNQNLGRCFFLSKAKICVFVLNNFVTKEAFVRQ